MPTLKYFLARLPPPAIEYLNDNVQCIHKGAIRVLKDLGADADIPIHEQTNAIAILSRVLSTMSQADDYDYSRILGLLPSAITTFLSFVPSDTPVRSWEHFKLVGKRAINKILSSDAFVSVTKNYPVFESNVAKQSLATFLIAYYLTALGGCTEYPALQRPEGAERPKASWLLSPKGYELEYQDHLVVHVRNVLPLDEPEQLSAVTDPFGTYHDIIFASALLAAIHTNILIVSPQVRDHLMKMLPVAMPPHDVTFEDAFYRYQRLLVDNYASLSKRISHVADFFSHLVTVIFDADPRAERHQFGDERTFVDVRLRPGTYWVHANFIALLADDLPEDVLGTTKRNDTALFNDKSFVQAPALRVTKLHLFRMLTDPRANRREYLILVRSRKRVRKQKSEGEGESSEPKPLPSRIEYELLSAIPISPEVAVQRRSDDAQLRIMDVVDTFGLSDPSSYKDVLDSLYLLARAYAPSYAVLYDGGIVGKDQYLALISAMLSYLSPTLSITRFDRKYDPRIHTLLYGIKGVGKTYLFEQYFYNWPHNTLFLFAGVRISEAKLLGGALQLRVGRSAKLVFQPGEIIKADGGMIMIDELDRLARDANKRPIADAIANVMASGFAPARHIMSDSPSLDVRVHSAVLAAANPLGLKSGKYVEEMLAAMFILNDEIRAHYKSLAPEVVEEIESKLFENKAPNVIDLSGKKLTAELEYLASDTPYTFIHQDFYSDPILHKYIDRVSFVIPMYTMVGEPPEIFLRSGKTASGDIIVYDPLSDGKITVPHKALLDFTLYHQTVSPFIEGDSSDALQYLFKKAAHISSTWRKSSSKTYAQKIRATVDSRETMRIFLKAMGSREAKVAYRLAHTILKLFGETELRRPYVRAILELLNIRDSLLYSNPSGHIKAPIALPEAIRMAIRDILYNGAANIGGQTVYFVAPEHIEAAYVDILSKYIIRIPEKDDATFDAVEHFQNVVAGTINKLRGVVLVARQDEEGNEYPALVGMKPEDLVKDLSFKVNKQGYLHVYYKGDDLGSLGRVV